MQRVVLTLIALASLPIAIGCGDGVETRKAPLVSEGTDNVVGLTDFNVLLHRELRELMATSDENQSRLWNLSAATRATAIQIRPDRNVLEGGVCTRRFEMGNGFLTGYSSMVTAHHTDWADSPFTSYRFAFPDFADGPDEPYTRRRLYRLGFVGKADSLYDELESDIKNWKFENYEAPANTWYAQLQRDAELKVALGPKCLVDDETQARARVFGPGLFFDWLEPLSNPEFQLQEDEETFVAHVNSYVYEEPPFAGLYDPATEEIVIPETTDPDISNLGSLPQPLNRYRKSSNVDTGRVLGQPGPGALSRRNSRERVNASASIAERRFTCS